MRWIAMMAYLKKFLWMLLITWCLGFSYNVIAGTVGNVLGVFWNDYHFRYVTSWAIAVGIVLLGVRWGKKGNREKRIIYKKAKEQQKSRLLIALKSKDFRQEVIVFLAFLIPMALYTVSYMARNVLEGIFLFVFGLVVIEAIYSFFVLLVNWMVYRAWDKVE
jgi:hypothetical protein